MREALDVRQAAAGPGVPGWKAWTAVAVGGLIGTELRFGAGLLFPETAGQVPWTTLAINVTRKLRPGHPDHHLDRAAQDRVLAACRHRPGRARLLHHLFGAGDGN